MGKPTVLVCEGSSCRKEKRQRRALVEAVKDLAKVKDVGCQKICEAPVCGVEIDGELEWFEEVSSPRALEGLRALLEGGALSSALKKRRVKRRRGKLRD